MENPLDGLDSISWGKLSHAYGDADDVPGLLRALVSDSPKKAESAISDLFASILHQGTIYTATIPAIPFLRKLRFAPKRRVARKPSGF